MSGDSAKMEGNNASEELDVGNERFNPLRALYAADYKVTEKAPKVVYQNIAAFESALVKVGIWQLNKRPKSSNVTAEPVENNPLPSSSSLEQATSVRRFEPHQMTIKGTHKTRHLRSLFTHMKNMEGPLAFLGKYLPAQDQISQTRVRVYVRKEHGIRGTIEGELVAYDKQWNLLLKNALEVWQRRKYKYGEQKIQGNPATDECSERLRQLGITLPVVQVKSLNRKNVQLTRELPQLMIRGEHVVLISCIKTSRN